MDAPVRELIMTTICKTCTNQYGLWRRNCPVCGTATPITKREVFNAPVVVRVRERPANECIFCHRRGAKETCAHCNEPIHHNCRNLHVGDCQQFQVERQQILERSAS